MTSMKCRWQLHGYGTQTAATGGGSLTFSVQATGSTAADAGQTFHLPLYIPDYQSNKEWVQEYVRWYGTGTTFGPIDFELISSAPVAKIPLLDKAVEPEKFREWQLKCAHFKSMRLLKRWLTEKEYASVVMRGEIPVRSGLNPDVIYIVRRRNRTLVVDAKTGRLEGEMCRILADPRFVDNDELLCKVMELKADEEEFVRGAAWTVAAPRAR